MIRRKLAPGLDPGAPGSEPGDLLWERGTLRYAPRYPVEIVDRIGAGESFVAGLVHGLLDGDPDRAIRLASYGAAIAHDKSAVSRPAAMRAAL